MIKKAAAALLLATSAATAQTYLGFSSGGPGGGGGGGGGGGPPPTTCLQGSAYVDGCSSAPTGTAQFPNILSSYAQRPPWNVAGVDYYVGVPAGTTLKDPAGGGLPSGCSYGSNTVTCSSGSPTLDGWDFSLHNGVLLNITGGSTISVQNSKFVVGSNQVSSQGSGTARIVNLASGSYNFVFQDNEVDGASLGGTAQASQTINVNNTGTNTWKYNYFHNIGGDLFDFNAGTRTNIIQYNAIWNIGIFTAHSDTLQWFGAGEQNPVISFNLSYQTVDEPGPGMGQMALFGEGAGSSLTNGKMMNNTIISTSGCAQCNWLLTAELDDSATGSNVTLKDNYVDPTGELGWTGMWFYAVGFADAAFPNPTTVANTVNMVTGSTYTSFPTATSPAYFVVPDVNSYTPPMNDVYTITASPSSGTVTTGSNITFTLSMDDSYTVSGGTPTLTLSNGKTAALTSGSGTSSLVFTYAVQSGDTGTSLGVSSLALNGATIKDAVGNSAVFTGIAKTFTGLNVNGGGGTTGWPGQAGNPVGYAAYGSGVLGTTAWPGGSFTSGTSTNHTVYTGYKFTGSQTISGIYIDFVQCDFNSGTGGVNVTGSNITFTGSRFQSNNFSNYNVQVSGSNITFSYDSFTPLASLYTSPPGAAWPSAGTGTNTITQTADVNSIAIDASYQYGLSIQSSAGSVNVDHSDFWGFGNIAAQWLGTISQMNFTNNWVHDTCFPNGQQEHSDGVGFVQSIGTGPSNLLIQGNTIASLGNTQAIAFQQAPGGGYSNIQIIGNYLSGYGYTVAIAAGSTTPFSGSSFKDNVLGTDIADAHGPLYGNNWNATSSVWKCNTIAFKAGTTWSDGTWTPTSSANGKFWVPTSSVASSTDYLGNASCP